MQLRLCNAPATFQRYMMAIFHELIEDTMEVFMENFLVFGSSFDHFLENLEKMLKRCEETNIVLNWEKCHFMVKEGIVLSYKVSGSRIKVDKAKIESISKLPYLTNIKAIRSFLGHVEFDNEIYDKKGAKNLVADHLSRLENPDLKKLTRAEIQDLFPEEQLMKIFDKSDEPCDLWHFFGMNPSYSNNAWTKSYEDVSLGARMPKFFDNVIAVHQEDIMGSPPLREKFLRPDSTGLIYFAMNKKWSKLAMYVSESATFLQGMKHPKGTYRSVKYLTFRELISWGCSLRQTETSTS
ncbi:reverse transcriptase domain-containing protein [Tanacetum coccineum]